MRLPGSFYIMNKGSMAKRRIKKWRICFMSRNTLNSRMVPFQVSRALSYRTLQVSRKCRNTLFSYRRKDKDINFPISPFFASQGRVE